MKDLLHVNRLWCDKNSTISGNSKFQIKVFSLEEQQDYFIIPKLQAHVSKYKIQKTDSLAERLPLNSFRYVCVRLCTNFFFVSFSIMNEIFF